MIKFQILSVTKFFTTFKYSMQTNRLILGLKMGSNLTKGSSFFAQCTKIFISAFGNFFQRRHVGRFQKRSITGPIQFTLHSYMDKLEERMTNRMMDFFKAQGERMADNFKAQDERMANNFKLFETRVRLWIAVTVMSSFAAICFSVLGKMAYDNDAIHLVRPAKSVSELFSYLVTYHLDRFIFLNL